MPFPSHKTIKELGIDTTRKFRVVGVSTFNLGDILVLERDDGTDCPYFKRLSDGYCCCKSLNFLEYADEEPKVILEKDGIKVGDRVEYELHGKTYNGYVAVIDPRDWYFLRLGGFSGHEGEADWCYDWFPESEKKGERNCFWTKKQEFKVVKEESLPPIATVITACGVFPLTEHDFDKSVQVLTTNNLTNHKPTGNKIMSNIVKFAKEMTLSSEEKLLRKHGLQDENGNWTQDAREIALEKKAESLGYKSWGELCNKIGQNASYSTIEMLEMIENCKPSLVEIAQKAEEAEKKSKK